MALIGATTNRGYDSEIRKIEALTAANHKPDIIADLSLAPEPTPLWKRIVAQTPFVAASLPIYSVRRRRDKVDTLELLERAIEQMEGGVGLLTIHPTPTLELIALSGSRLVPCTSRGGGIVIRDLLTRNASHDNVYRQIMPGLIECALKTRTVLSLGASFRSANIFDANDDVQQAEIAAQKLLADDIVRRGVDVIIESPGHARPRTIRQLGNQLRTIGYPIMPLGPIPTDIAIGNDHIAGSIGAVLLGLQGAAHILAAVTREEHTGGVPKLDSTLEAIACARIAAHIIDLDTREDMQPDMDVAYERQQHKTCIVGKISRGCSRCGSVCPL